MSGGRRRQVLTSPHVLRLLGTSLIARLPTAMVTLAVLLLLGPSHGYGLAGLACMIYVGASAVGNPIQARLVDRIGARRVLIPASVINGLALVAMAALSSRLLALDMVAAAAAGVALPPVTAVVRGQWPRLLPAEQVQVLYGLEATAQELIYLTGPALLALLAGAFGARTALILTAMISVAGTGALVSTPVFVAGGAAVVAQRRPLLLRSPRLLAWLTLAASLTMAFGITEVAVVAFVAPGHAGGTFLSGLVLAAWSAGSMIGGIAFGRRERQITDRSVLVAGLLIGATSALPALALGAAGLAALLFLSGCAIAPGLARLYTRISASARASSQTEAFGWLAVAFTVGNAAGVAIGGATASGLGARSGLALGAVPPLLGAAIAVLLLRRTSDRPRHDEMTSAIEVRVESAPVASPM